MDEQVPLFGDVLFGGLAADGWTDSRFGAEACGGPSTGSGVYRPETGSTAATDASV
jgi:hypothetical protein